MATTCPEITTPDNDDIKLSTYARDVGTTVVLACRQFGQHVKEPTSVTCLASGQWSIQPNLECEINLNYKERVYLATAIIASLVLLFGCCWITLATLCCRRYRDPYRKSRWDDIFRRRGRSTDRRIIVDDRTRDKYDDGFRYSSFGRQGYKNQLFDRKERYSDRNSYKTNNRKGKGGWNVFFMGVDGTTWDRSQRELEPGESWRYDTHSYGTRSEGGGGRAVDREDVLRRKHDFRLGDEFRRSRTDYDDNRLLARNSRYHSETVDNIPKNDMESIYRLRRRYDRVFAEEHPRFADHYLPRDPNRIGREKIGNNWESNYPVLRLAEHETIYSPYGDPLLKRRRNSDTFLDRRDHNTRGIEYMSGGGVGGYRQTRRYSDTVLEAEPARQSFYTLDYGNEREQMHGVEETGMGARQVLVKGGRYEVITIPSSEQRSEIYTTAVTGPKLRQLDANNLELPSYTRTGAYVLTNGGADYIQGQQGYRTVTENLERPSYTRTGSYVVKNGGTDYFQGRQEVRTDLRKSKKELDYIMYHGHGKKTEVYEEVSERGRNSPI